ncbi:MAG: hypothetical protein JO257_37580 [Deltaproteobacteria bacterium]|nr:hypothetical protein [Deltaproteobacteria bacterium]
MRNAYRDELEAAQARADALERENRELRGKLEPHIAVVPAPSEVSPVTLHVLATFAAIVGMMLMRLAPTAGMFLFAGGAVLFVVAQTTR